MSNNFIICKKCGNRIPNNYKNCPNCGYKLKKSKWLLWTLLIIFGAPLVLLFAFFSFAFFCAMVFSEPVVSGDVIQTNSGNIEVVEENKTEEVEQEISKDPNYGISKSRVNSAFKLYNEILDYITNNDYDNAIKKYNYLINNYSNVTLELTHEEILNKIEDLIPRVSAVELAKVFNENEIKAKNLYGGKLIIVTGTINSIGIDILDTPYITLNDGEKYSLSTPQCYFENKEEIAKIAELKEGDKITIKGKCKDSLMGSAKIYDCFIVEE